MTEFAGIQTSQTLDAPNPDAPIYRDPLQWWYDMTPSEQEAYRERKVAKLREIMAVCGIDGGIITHDSFITPTNPDGIQPATWAEYNRVIAEKGYAAKPVETLTADLAYHSSEVVKIEAALSGFSGVQGG